MKIYRIWQLPHNNPQLFRDYNEEEFDFKNYCCVWWDNWDNEIPTNEQLESIFYKFNCELPEHYAGHSLSVSDVVEVRDTDGGKSELYYCCDFGWELVGSQTKRTWKIEEYEFTMHEMVHNVTRECARKLMNDNEFKEFCKLQDEAIKKHDKTQEEFAKTHYFPGCYGDPRVDC